MFCAVFIFVLYLKNVDANVLDRIKLDYDKPLVLLVDDSALALKLVRRALKQDGVDVEIASDGFEASVIIDIQMPVIGGIESIRQLREWEARRLADGHHQQILAASACPDASTRDEAYRKVLMHVS